MFISILIKTIREGSKNKYMYLILIVTLAVMMLNRSIVFRTISFGDHDQSILYASSMASMLLYLLFFTLFLHSTFKDEYRYAINGLSLLKYYTLHILKALPIIIVLPFISLIVGEIMYPDADYVERVQSSLLTAIRVLSQFVVLVIYSLGFVSININQTSKRSVRNMLRLAQTRVLLYSMALNLLYILITFAMEYAMNAFPNNSFTAIVNYVVAMFGRAYIPLTIAALTSYTHLKATTAVTL